MLVLISPYSKINADHVRRVCLFGDSAAGGGGDPMGRYKGMVTAKVVGCLVWLMTLFLLLDRVRHRGKGKDTDAIAVSRK